MYGIIILASKPLIRLKNKEVAGGTATSKKGRDIMLTLQTILIGLAIHITSKIVDVIVDAIN